MTKVRARIIRSQDPYPKLTSYDWVEIAWQTIPELQKAGIKVHITPLPEKHQIQLHISQVKMIKGKLKWHKKKRQLRSHPSTPPPKKESNPQTQT